MIIVMEPGAEDSQVQQVVSKLEEAGFRIVLNRGDVQTVVAAIGDNTQIREPQGLSELPGVKETLAIQEPYKLASREVKHDDTVVTFPNGVKIGEGQPLAVMAGPCSVEKVENVVAVAQSVKRMGAGFLRGGAFKPRTSPYDFQGLEEDGLKLLDEAREQTGLLVVTEVMDTTEVDIVSKHADMLQVGARNMQNFKLLKAVGKQPKPVLLKRGLSATIREFLLAAEYILYHGNENVILCERGIRSFDSAFTRNVLDLSAIPVIKKRSHLPIIVDPSHGTGHRYLIEPMSRAAIASGADGLMIEVHAKPEEALSDGQQSLNIPQFEHLMAEINRMAQVMGRPVAQTV